jgi:hypothetical protein
MKFDPLISTINNSSSRLLEAGGDGHDDEQDDEQKDDDADAEASAAAALVFLGLAQLLVGALHVVGGVGDVPLDVVELLPLRLHHDGHVEEHLVELEEAALHLARGVVAVLDLVQRGEHGTLSVLRDGGAHEFLAAAVGDDAFDHLLLGDLPRERVVAALDGLLVLRHHPLPQRLEVEHEVLELLPEPRGDGGAGAVERRALAAARGEPPLEPGADVAGAAENGDDVGIDAAAVRAKGVDLVQRLALLVGGVEAVQRVSDGRHLRLHRLRLLEETAQALVRDAARLGKLDPVAPRLQVLHRRLLQVDVAHEGLGHEVVHGADLWIALLPRSVGGG